MDTTNSPNPHLPARILSSSSSRLPTPVSASMGMPMAGASGGGAAAPSSINPKTLLRAMLRHWWRILGLSLIVSLPIAYVIWIKVEPKYEAVAIIEVKASKPNLYGVKSGETGEKRYLDQYLQTQLNLIPQSGVLARALNDPKLTGVNLPMISKSEDPITDLSKALVVENLKDTFLIRVSLQSESSNEAYLLVQAVTNAYMEEVRLSSGSTTTALMRSLENESGELQKKIEDEEKKLFDLTKKGTIQFAAKTSETGDSKNPNQAREGEVTATTVSESHYAEVRSKYHTTLMELDAAEQMLKKKLEEQDPAKKAANEESESMIANAAIDRQIETEFNKDPEVIEVLKQIDEKEQELKRVSDIARQSNDPAARWMKKRLLELEKQYIQLWDSKYEQIRERLVAENPATPMSNESVKELQIKVADLQAHAQAYEKSLRALKVEDGEARLDAVKADFAREKLRTLHNSKTQIDNLLNQTKFENKDDLLRVTIKTPARVPVVPTLNKRIKLMAMVPVGVMALILGVFLLLEIKAERISDPESLSLRVQSEVFALPPLPSAREVRKMRELESGSDQIDRFIQRLDHLRFAVFGSQASVDQGRCVLVTSAVGGEGKSTLAAQLAARCGSSGISTILIDADMRRSSLGTLLDLPEGVGLSDVLKGDISVEEAAIPVQGGTFHVLLAGTPIDDVSRILHGQNVGILIARLREMYDLIVIDSPPVLPVPDALVLGQWTDGAILASRFDISRFPQVERARKQLDSAGIPIVGTVINGMRSVDSYYGDYSYARRQSPQSGSSGSI